ncbi:MAG: hypothetical protein E7261_07675 [Lachnospiraceae bacterium]|nr:hypothetical protein [Lachnospiraceae bacterium]
MKNYKKIVALAMVVVMAMTGFVACGKNPKETVMDALETLVSGASMKGLADELGITEIMEKVGEGSFTIGMEAGLDIPDDESQVGGNMAVAGILASSTIKAEIACDAEAKKALLALGANVSGSDLLSGQIYIDEKQLAVAAPELLDKVFFVEFDDIIKNFKKSALYDMMGVTDEDFSMIEESFKNFEKLAEDKDTEKMVEFFLGFNEEIEEFKDKIEVEKIDAEEFEINGKDRKCDGYELVITKKSIANLVEAAIDYYFLSDEAKEFYESIEAKAEEMGGVADMEDLYDAMDEMKENKKEIVDTIKSVVSDVEAEIYIYEGEIVSLDAKIEITDPSGESDEKVKIGLNLECTGGEYSVYDNYELSVKAMGMKVLTLEKESEADKDEYSVEWTVSSAALEGVTIGASFVMDKKDGDFEASAIFDDGEMKFSFAAEGTVEIEKKKSVKVEIDALTVSYNDYWDAFSIGLSGEYYVKCDADVSMPKGDKFNVLTEKESDWEALAEDLEDVMNSLSGLMGDIY